MYGWAPLDPDPNRVVAPAAGATASSAVAAATVAVPNLIVHLERLVAPLPAAALLVVLIERSFLQTALIRCKLLCLGEPAWYRSSSIEFVR
jgi:hypothetical protein